MVGSRIDKRKGMRIAGRIVGLIFLCLFFVIISDRRAYAAEIPSSEFEDIDLYNYLLENYDTDGDGMLETEEAEAVFSIAMYYTAPESNVAENISSFKGLEYFTNMYSFGITYDSETEPLDISALSSMTWLTSLTVEGHKNILDFTALYSLTNLTRLAIENTNVADISFVANMPNLELLRIAYCDNITDGSSIASLSKLSEFNMSMTGITDISFLNELENLEIVHMTDNVISDFKPLEKSVGSLKTLYIGAYSLSTEGFVASDNLDFLGEAVNLETLFISGLGLTDIPDLTALTNLTTFYLGDNYLSIEETVSKIPANITAQDNWMENSGMYWQRERAGDTSNLNDGIADAEVDENIEIELEGTFPAGTFLETSMLTDNAILTEYKNKLESRVSNIKLMWLFDISTYKLQYVSGRLQKYKSQPTSTTTVRVTIPINSNYEYHVFRQEEDGTFTELQCTLLGDRIEFYSDHFSIFSIIASLIFGTDDENDTVQDSGDNGNDNNVERPVVSDDLTETQSSYNTDDNAENESSEETDKNDYTGNETIENETTGNEFDDTANVNTQSNDDSENESGAVNQLPSIIVIIFVIVGIIIFECIKN